MKSVKGFTLIELMVTIAVLAIVISMAAPSFAGMLQDHRISTLSAELQGALQLARSESVKRKERVEVCRSNTGATACANGGSWEGGWLIRTSTEVIKVWDPAQGVSISGPAAGLTFLSNGMVEAAGSFTVDYSGCTGQKRRTISVNRTGSSTLAKGSC